MDVLTLIGEARTAGLRISTCGDKLIIKGPKVAEPLARRLGQHKPEVMAALRPPVNETGTIGTEWIEPDYLELSDVSPCPICGSTSAWWTATGDHRCMVCQPPLTALRALDHAQCIRRRLGLHHPQADHLRHALQQFVRV